MRQCLLIGTRNFLNEKRIIKSAVHKKTDPKKIVQMEKYGYLEKERYIKELQHGECSFSIAVEPVVELSFFDVL